MPTPTRRPLRPFVALVLAGALLAPALPPLPARAAEPEIKLNGSGPRRQALDELSFKPFDTALLSRLSGFSGGTGSAVNAETLKGRPALLVVWAGWFRPSHAGLTLAQQQADTNPDLVVLGIHHQRGYDQARATADTLKIKAPIAHDASGEVLRALKADSAGPIFYLIDRAGRLRFADVERASLEPAIKLLVAETEQSAAQAARPGADQSAEPAPGSTPGSANAPTPEQYKAAKWPAHNTRGLSARSVQGRALPVAFGKNETWLTPKLDTSGKVIVLDFWATWCGPCLRASPILDDLQKKHAGQALIIGVGGQGEDERTIREFIKKKPTAYSHVFDANQRVYKSLSIRGIPHVAVLSTDGIVRWQGNPLDPAFVRAVDAVVANDPGIVPSAAGVSPDQRPARAPGSAPRP